MRVSKLTVIAILALPAIAFAAQTSMYCAQNAGYINIGDTQDQVLAACGQPVSKQTSNVEATQKVPVTQLIYNNSGAPSAKVGTWSIATGNGTGAQVQINVMNNQVSSINLNGESTNQVTTCGKGIQVGDPLSKVYNTCGQPSIVNQSFINQPVASDAKPEIWIYKPDPYSSATVTLTFVNGQLQSIN